MKKRIAFSLILVLIFSLFLLLQLQKTPSWHYPDFPQRIPIEIVKPPKEPQMLSLFIPREALPREDWTNRLAFTVSTRDGKDIRAFASPDGKSGPQFPASDTIEYPRVIWLSLAEEKQVLPLVPHPTRLFVYAKHTDQIPDDPLPFLLTHTFEDLWPIGWEFREITKEEAPLSWMAGLMAGQWLLPDDGGAGYTVEALTEETTDKPGGPAIVLAGKDFVYSWERRDGKTFHATGPAFSEDILADTAVKKPFHLRLDLPRTPQAPVRFFIDGRLLKRSPLSHPLVDPVRMFLLRTSSEGIAYFRWLIVRQYQKEEPVYTVGNIEQKE